MSSSSSPQGIQQWDYSSKVAGSATCTVTQTKIISIVCSCTVLIGSSLLSHSTTHLKNGQVSTKRGPDVMWTSFRLRVCAAERIYSQQALRVHIFGLHAGKTLKVNLLEQPPCRHPVK